MRVALVVPGGVDRSGTHGVLPLLLWLVARLARRHDVHVFAMRGEPEAGTWTLDGATVHEVGDGPGPRTVRAAAALVAEHRRRPFDVVHAFWASGPGVVAALAAPLVRRPVLLHVVGGDLVGMPDVGYGALLGPWGRARVAFALRGATLLAAESGPVLDALADRRRQAVRLPLGVDRRAWPPAAPRPRDRSRPARLVHVGSLNRVKDQPTLLRAFARLVADGADATLDLVGGDTLGGEVQAVAAGLGMNGRVRFHGFLPQAELRPLVESADVMVVSSRHESGPMVALEAAAVGVPVVGTDVGRLRDWAPDAAVTVPVGDADALAGAIADLLDDDARRMRVAAAAGERALAEDADWSAARVTELYERLAGGVRG